MLFGLAFLGNALGKSPTSAAVGSVVYLTLGMVQAWLLARFIDRRPFSDYGFHLSPSWWMDLGFGLILGAILMTGIFVTERLAGWVVATAVTVTDSGLAPAPALFLSVFFYLVVAFNEEFAFRGYQMRNLAEGLAGARVSSHRAIVLAWVISSSIFGLGHATNEYATALSTFNIMAGGLLLTLPYLLTGELAMSIGLHTSWNLFQGTVFGFPVSGSLPSRRVLILEQTGPTIWTGGPFGPEGGFLATIFTFAGCVLIAMWVWARRGRVSLQGSSTRYEPVRRRC
jgi:membrane protease YdiL (CAAX protease family)